MKIGRTSVWYRPYGVSVNNKGYYVNSICFYENDSILVSTNFGWLQTGKYNNDIDSIELPVEEIKLKRKVKFDGSVFVTLGKDIFGETTATLYIPAEMLNVHFAENKKYNDHVEAIYKGDCDIYISTIIKWLNAELHVIRDEYEEVYKKVTDTCLAVHKAEEVLENIDKLKALAEAYIAERKRIAELKIEDIQL